MAIVYKYSLSIVCGVLIHIFVLSQEQSIYYNSYLDPFITNPAFSGVEYYKQAHLSVEKQWMDIPNSPVTIKFTVNSKPGRFNFYDPDGLVNKGALKLKERLGFGLVMYNDANGPLSNFGGILSAGYHIPFGGESGLSFGMSTLITGYSLNSSMLDPDNPDDGYLFSGNEDQYNVNFGSGVLYRKTSFFIGVAANKLLPGIAYYGLGTVVNPNYYTIVGYNLEIQSNVLSYEPCIELKYLSNNFYVDFHSKLYYKRLHWLAISVSSLRSMNVRMALNIYKKLYAGYNYGFTFNNSELVMSGMHQISLGINLGLIGVEGVRKTI